MSHRRIKESARNSVEDSSESCTGVFCLNFFVRGRSWKAEILFMFSLKLFSRKLIFNFRALEIWETDNILRYVCV